MQIDKKYLIVLSILVIVGAILRLYNLGFNSFWLDESDTRIFTQLPFFDYWHLINSAGEVHPPLFYVVEKIILPFGDNEFLYRLIPAIFGIITIPIFFFIGKLLFDDTFGLLMACLLCFSPFHIQYSQDARMYTMLLFFVSFAFFWYLKALKTDTIRYWTLFGLFSALAIWTHFIAFLLIGMLLLYSLVFYVKNKLKIKNLVISVGLIAVLCMPLLYIIKDIFISRIGPVEHYGFSGVDFFINSLSLLLTNNSLAFIIFLILLILGSIWLFFEERQKFGFLFSIIFIFFLVLELLSFKMPLFPRYSIAICPLLFTIIVASSLPFLKIAKPNLIIGVFSILIIALCAPQIYSYYTTPAPYDWRGLAIYISENAHLGDTIVIMPEYNKIPFDYYYNNSTHGTYEKDITYLSELKNVNKNLKNNNTEYIVITDDMAAADPSGEAVSWIANNTELVGDFSTIFLLKR